MISAKIVADSICNGNRITTMEVVFPRFILAELNTHRLFSRNSASSRAIPFEKMVKEVEENPFIPMAWQKDHKGMQGNEYLTEQDELNHCIDTWLRAKNNAVIESKNLSCGILEPGTTKQLCNRLLEPFMWHKVLITATEWDNFFDLRCPDYVFHNDEEYHFKSKKDVIKQFGEEEEVEYESGNVQLKELTDLHWLTLNKGQSEIHMMALAEAMYDAINESTPKELKSGEWHIPYGDDIEYKKTGYTEDGLDYQIYNDEEDLIKIATARCARLSYQTLGDNPKINYDADIKLHDSLLSSGHFSPFEHCAKAMTKDQLNQFEHVFPRKGFKKNELMNYFVEKKSGWCNNFKGWIQYRYLIENK